MKKYSHIYLPVICLIGALGIWEFCVKAFQISSYVLPAPSRVAGALWADAGELWMHSMVTLEEAVIGLFIATILAVFIAIVMDLSGLVRNCLMPYLIISQTVPAMILGPIFTMWLGFGMAPKILIVVFMCFFPVAISFSDALRQVDPRQLNLLKSFGASKVQQYCMVKIPGAATALFSGLKVSATYCIGGAIVGEWLSASAGLGFYMIRVKNGFMMDKVFASVIIIVAWSLLLNLAVTFLEWIIFPHKRKRKGKR